MSDKNTRWENDKEWAGWTLRDEIYASVRSHVGPYVVSGAAALAVAAYAYAQSHPTLAAMIGTAIGTFIVIIGSAAFSRRRKLTAGRAAERDTSVQIQRAWPALSRRQISALRNRLAATHPTVGGRNNRHIEIVREEFSDCADLADDIAEAFQSGWSIPNITPDKIWGHIQDGIWIVGPRDDPRKPILLSIFSEVLGPEYEPIGLETTVPAPIPALDAAAVIRVAIGRKPRRN